MDALRRDFPGVRVVRARDATEIEASIAEAEILFCWGLGDAVFERARSLRWLHAPAAGVGAYLTPSIRARASHLTITNSRGVHAIPIAEHTVGMLLGLARDLPRAARQQAQGAMDRKAWFELPAVPRELAGLTLGLFGYGAIGREVARRALACGMRVVALKRDTPLRGWDPGLLETIGLPAEEPAIHAMYGPGDFDRFLGESDAVAITAALTPETEGRFDARAFSLMKPGSWLVNIARGKIVREADLVEALRAAAAAAAGGPAVAGGPAAAALDVFEREPLPPESPLYTLDNVTLTPHVSGLSTGYWPRSMALFRANLERWLDGRPLWNEVDPARGY